MRCWRPPSAGGVREKDYYLAIALMDTVIGCWARFWAPCWAVPCPFDTTGVDFAMTALFIVIAVGQWKGTRNHLPAAIGCLATLASLRLAGEDNMLILALVVIVAALLVFSPKMPEGQALHKAG